MKKICLFMLVGIFVISSLSFVSAATFTNVVSNCTAEDNAAKGSFGLACGDATGASLQADDVSVENHIYQKTPSYGGCRKVYIG